jgi:hypothetical protein
MLQEIHLGAFLGGLQRQSFAGSYAMALSRYATGDLDSINLLLPLALRKLGAEPAVAHDIVLPLLAAVDRRLNRLKSSR